ncbi:MAG: SRPBCC domain-containing protein [Pseudomonadota bacterium]
MSDGGPVVSGVIDTDENGIAFVNYSQTFGQTVDVVWEALNDPHSRLSFLSRADLRVGGQIAIRFGEDYEEVFTISEVEPPLRLTYVNVETHGHPAKYYTDSILLTEEQDTCCLSLRTPIGGVGRLQAGIAVGWHIWIENWRQLLNDPQLTKDELEASLQDRQREAVGPYVDQLKALYPDWPGE